MRRSLLVLAIAGCTRAAPQPIEERAAPCPPERVDPAVARPAPPAPRLVASCPYAPADTGDPGSQAVVIVAASVDEIYRLRLIDLRGLSLLDHPRADPEPDGRVGVTGYADDDALRELCARGCTRDRRCDVRVVTTKQALRAHWDRVFGDPPGDGDQTGTTRPPPR